MHKMKWSYGWLKDEGRRRKDEKYS